MRRYLLGVLTGAGLVGAVLYVRACIEAQRTYDAAMDRLLASVPQGQRADFRSPEEQARNPRPTRWEW